MFQKGEFADVIPATVTPDTFEKKMLCGRPWQLHGATVWFRPHAHHGPPLPSIVPPAA